MNYKKGKKMIAKYGEHTREEVKRILSKLKQ